VYQVLPNNGLQFVNKDETSYRTNWNFYNRKYNDGEYATYVEVEYEPIEQWCISHERMVELADSIRAKKNTTAIFTPAQMVAEIDGIVTGDDLPDAEDNFFGTEESWTEYGITNLESMSVGGSMSGNTKSNAGFVFTVNSTFSVTGLRVGKLGTVYAQLWDYDTKTLITEITCDSGSGTVVTMLPKAVNLIAGKKYVISALNGSANQNSARIYRSEYIPKYNAKITCIANGKVDTGRDVCPEFTGTGSPYYKLDMVMGPALTESETTEYKIQTETMASIADEVKRITGTVGTMSPAQIITALQGVAVQTTE
jgi:hypothetical protein